MNLSEMTNGFVSNNSKTLIFPEFHQTHYYDCVASGLVSILAANNITARENDIMRMAGTTKENGTDPIGVVRVLRHFKIPHKCWKMMPQDLRNAIEAGHPVLLMLQAYRDNPSIPYSDCLDDGHSVICIGYDRAKFVFEDPASSTRTWLDERELLKRWHDTDISGNRFNNWGCEILTKQPFASKPVESIPMQ